jgi:hypothetical protein
MTLIDSARTDIRPTSGSSTRPAPLAGSYITTRTTPRDDATTGTYTSRRPASAAHGSYVTTASPTPVSGGSYTYVG